LQEPDYKNVTSRELKEKLDRGEEPILLDVREPWEFSLARIVGSKLIPMAEIFDRLPDLDPHAETVVICHHGARSAYATRILNRSGFENAYNLEGGLDVYSSVDVSVSRY
jgi:rhodanese-related sulfurtransferase